MAGRGPAPTGSARRRNKQPPGADLPAADGVERHGPEIGPRPGYVVVTDKITKESRRVKLRWLSVTLEWWDMWRTSAQASLMGPVDWLALRETAVLVDDFYRGETKNAAEIRLRCAKFGQTPEDRQRLRMTLGSPAPRANTGAAAPPAPPRDEVSSARERRERIAQRAAGGDA